MQVSDTDWWDRFYQQRPEIRDWYLPNEIVVEALTSELCRLRPGQHVLHVGCGSSEIPLILQEKGYGPFTNNDISPAVIEAMKEKYGSEEMKFEVEDVEKMSYADSSFPFVFDKGTLDSVVCSNKPERGKRMVSEIYRVLSPGGQVFIFSVHPPEARLPFFKQDGMDWEVSALVVDESPLEVPDQSETFLYVASKKSE